MPRGALRVFRNAGGDFFQNFERNLLRFAVVGKVALKIPVQFERLAGIVLRSQNHVAQAHGVRQHRVFLEFIERRFDADRSA